MTDISNSRPIRHRSRIIREVALTIGAVTGLLCIIAAAVAVLFGITPLIIQSGSMEPTIPTGSLAIADTVPATDIRPGDVISVTNEQGIRITHRVVSVDSTTENFAALTLQGDANSVPDSQSYVITAAERVVFHVDGLGYVAAWLHTPAARILGGLAVVALLWLVIFPAGRRRSGEADAPTRSRKPQHLAGNASSLVIVGLTTALAVVGGSVQGSAAAYIDSASATTGSFASRNDFVPRLNDPFFGLTYVTCTNSTFTSPTVVTLDWKHIGAPYQYRIILRDLSGNVWRTVDVNPGPSAAIGSTLSATLGASGFPIDIVSWDYDAEIHTMLPGGAVSAGWRGYRVYKSLYTTNLHCRSGLETSGAAAYIPPPASITCLTNAAQKTATFSWPHLSGFTYRFIVRDATTGSIAYTSNILTAGGTPAGQAVTKTLAYSELTASHLSGTGAIVEVRTRVNDTTQSTEFVSRQVTASAANGVACVVPAPGARTAAPTTTASPSAGSTSSPPQSSTTAGTSPSGAPPVSTTITPTTPTTTATSPTPTSSTPAEPTEQTEQPISVAFSSSTGNYSAQLMQTSAGPAVVIRSSDGMEAYRVSAAADDSLQWVPGSDELEVTGATGSVTISRQSGVWVTTPS
ncbi:signal peptidase I [Williamsia sp. 1135]|uniref:signal peptidase I n=1 Tax=Williamsia sp. 1135 TaxID=1889262 RepID=UPI00143A9C20|nr:signal peptidase I [Williamsia sp. 1135]